MVRRSRSGGTHVRRARAIALIGAGALATFVACGDPYLHNNPYDPADSVAITIQGPDTLFSLGEIGVFAAQITPGFADTAVRWATSDTGELAPSGTASFVVSADLFGPPLYPEVRTVGVTALLGQEDTTISVSCGTPVPGQVCDPATGIITIHTYVWRHRGSKNVAITQRVTRIQLRCPDTHACDTVSVGGTWSVWVDGFDARNRQIVALTSATANPPTGPAIATFVARDTSVATVSPLGIRAASVTARKAGTTWIVATRDSLRDSLQLVAR